MYRFAREVSSNEWPTAIFTLLGVIIGALLNQYLEKRRNREHSLFEARKEIYAKILVGMSGSFIPKDRMDTFIADPLFNTKIRIEMGELLTQGRLVAGPTLSQLLREFYDNEVQIWDAVPLGNDVTALNIKRGDLVRRIESLMKEDLGVK